MQIGCRRFLLSSLALTALCAAPAAEAAYWYPKVPMAPSTSGGPPVFGVAADGTAMSIGGPGMQHFHDRYAQTTTPAGPVRTDVIFSEPYGSLTELAMRANGDAVVGVGWGSSESFRSGVVQRIGGVWSPAHVLTTGTATIPKVAIAADGTAAALWFERPNGFDQPAQLRAATRSALGVWSAPQKLLETNHWVEHQIAMDATGRTTVVWAGQTDSGPAVQAVERPSGGAWTSPVTIGATVFAQTAEFGITLAPDVNGAARLIVVYRPEPSLRSVYATRRVGGSWSTPSLVQSGIASTANLDVNASGQAVTTWVAFAGGKLQAYAAAASPGGAFGAPVTLGRSGSPSDSGGWPPVVAVADSGAAMIAWQSEFQTVAYRERAATGTLGPLREVPGLRQEVIQPALDVDATGRFVLMTDTPGGHVPPALVYTARSRPPVARITVGAATPGVPIALDAGDSHDPDGTIVSYAWDLDADGAYDDDFDAHATKALAPGANATVSLRVIDDTGEPRFAAADVTGPIVLPVSSFTFAPASPLTGQTITLTSTATGLNGAPSDSLQWDTDGDGNFHEAVSGASAQVSFAVPGSYRVGLVSDTYFTSFQTITVGNRMPTARLTSPESVQARSLVSLDASASTDPDPPPSAVTLKRYEWDLDGDGAFETDQGANPNAVAAYAQAGTVQLGLRVTDHFDGVAVATRTMAVTGVAGRSLVTAPVAVGPTGAARLIARGSRTLRFRAPRAGVLNVQRGARTDTLVFRRAGEQMLRLRGSRAARVRVTWTPRDGRSRTVTRSLRRRS